MSCNETKKAAHARLEQRALHHLNNLTKTIFCIDIEDSVVDLCQDDNDTSNISRNESELESLSITIPETDDESDYTNSIVVIADSDESLTDDFSTLSLQSDLQFSKAAPPNTDQDDVQPQTNKTAATNNTSNEIIVENTTQCNEISNNVPTKPPTAYWKDYNNFCQKKHCVGKDSTPIINEPILKQKTRSGRTVQQRLQFPNIITEQNDDVSDVSDNDDDDDDYEAASSSHVSSNKSASNDDEEECENKPTKSNEIYLDLKTTVTQMHRTPPNIVPADTDAQFKLNLQKFLGIGSTKRRLYTPLLELMEHNEQNNALGHETTNQTRTTLTTTATPLNKNAMQLANIELKSACNINLYSAFKLSSKNLDAINAESFAVYTAKRSPGSTQTKIILNKQICKRKHAYLHKYLQEHECKNSFLKSLYAESLKILCHPEAEIFQPTGLLDNNLQYKLARILFDLYNHKIFACNLNTKIVWTKKTTIVSSCVNTYNGKTRKSVIELSELRLRTAKTLLTTLIHEMCHAAAWIYNAEMGHGQYCNEWLFRAKEIFIELPMYILENCARPAHALKFECLLCQATSQGSLPLQSTDKTRLRCCYCLGPIDFEQNRAQTEVYSTTLKKSLTSYAQYVKDNYTKNAEKHDQKHSDIMLELSKQFLNNQD